MAIDNAHVTWVPEPATWVMMIASLAAVGASTRRARQGLARHKEHSVTLCARTARAT
ncbi:PEPxxWA-CTERM sorting domain-containing protein [Sphingomonas changbaiensis]|uniref:PEPxxWA-CTERM sorting domain-containing protein n=1 Tax=Sphingomonas changbaiensis TaxID=529705 RepID=UPI0009FF200A